MHCFGFKYGSGWYLSCRTLREWSTVQFFSGTLAKVSVAKRRASWRKKISLSAVGLPGCLRFRRQLRVFCRRGRGCPIHITDCISFELRKNI